MADKRDALGVRMKEQYENRTRFSLPRRTYTIIRCDGKAFHTFTRGLQKPYDVELAMAMGAATLALCKEAQGSQFGYVQSDEISVLLTDFATIQTDAWFDGNVQKIASVAASVVTAAFNSEYRSDAAHFDARVFTIPDPVEVENYFIWRQQDATRNSISGLAQAHFSAKQLHGVNNAGMQEMLFREKGINWNDCRTEEKRGRAAIYTDEAWTLDYDIPVFTAEREYLTSRIPRMA